MRSLGGFFYGRFGLSAGLRKSQAIHLRPGAVAAAVVVVVAPHVTLMLVSAKEI